MDPTAIGIALAIAAGAALLLIVGASAARLRPEFRILLAGCALTFPGFAVINVALGMAPGDCMAGGVDFGSCISTATAASQLLALGLALLAIAVALALVAGIVAVRHTRSGRRS
jgi:hypothetical protein